MSTTTSRLDEAKIIVNTQRRKATIPLAGPNGGGEGDGFGSGDPLSPGNGEGAGTLFGSAAGNGRGYAL